MSELVGNGLLPLRLLPITSTNISSTHISFLTFRPIPISSTSHFVYLTFRLLQFRLLPLRLLPFRLLPFRLLCFVSSTVIVEEVRLQRNGNMTIWDDIIGNPKVRRFLDAAQICKGWQMKIWFGSFYWFGSF